MADLKLSNKPSCPGKRRRERLPGDLQLPRGANSIPFALCHDADEVATSNDLHPGDVLDRRLVDAGHRWIADAVGALSARPYDAAVKHPGETDLLNVLICPAHLFGDVGPWSAGADDRYASRVFELALSALFRGSSIPPL